MQCLRCRAGLFLLLACKQTCRALHSELLCVRPPRLILSWCFVLFFFALRNLSVYRFQGLPRQFPRGYLELHAGGDALASSLLGEGDPDRESRVLTCSPLRTRSCSILLLFPLLLLHGREFGSAGERACYPNLLVDRFPLSTARRTACLSVKEHLWSRLFRPVREVLFFGRCAVRHCCAGDRYRTVCRRSCYFVALVHPSCVDRSLSSAAKGVQLSIVVT